MTAETEAEILACVRETLADPRGWVKATYRLRSYETGHVAYCLVGAIDHCAGVGSSGLNTREEIDRAARIKRIVRQAIKDVQGYKSAIQIERWNDRRETTHADVMAVLERALALAEV